MLEIISIWILVGVIADAFTMYAIMNNENSHMIRFCQSKGIPDDMRIHYGFIDIIKDTPLWAHVILIAFPPSALTRIGMINN